MFAFLTMIGGLALFLFGVRLLSQGMEQLAGGKIQEWLDRATSKPLKGAALGVVATALIQSSGLLMVTMIGLINARLLTLEQAIGVMLGQEIGATVTGQIVAFEVGNIRFVAVAIGLLLLEFGKEGRWQRYGQILLGFGIMFTGREMMADAVRPLANNGMAHAWLVQMGQHPLLGVLGGIVLTSAIQSSTATTGLVIAMGSSNAISLPAAIGFIYGANIGACFMGFLASLRASAPARRASMAQIIINVVGVLLFMPLISPYAWLLQHTSASLPRQIANAHTIFNIVVSVALFPFVKPLARLTQLLVPARPESQPIKVAEFIDEHLRGMSATAIMRASKEIERLGQTTLDMVELSRKALLGEKQGDQARQVVALDKEVVDPLCHLIEHFVDGLILERLEAGEHKRCLQLRSMNLDLERVAERAEDLAGTAQKHAERQADFSEEARQDLSRAFDHAQRTLQTALAAFRTSNAELARQTFRLEEEMDHVVASARHTHTQRMSAGACQPESDVLFFETLCNLKRISDHAHNIALAVIGLSAGGES